MADDQRLYRSNEAPARSGQARAQNSPSGSDPLAELARLIGQSDPFGEFGREGGRRQAAPAPQAIEPQAAMPAGGANHDEHNHYEADEQHAGYVAAAAGHDHDPYHPSNAQYASEEQDFYDDVPPSRRRLGIMVIAGVFALAVIGTAGAFGYRAIFGSSGLSGPPPVIKADATPSKIVPAGPGKDASSKLITDRVNDRAQDEKVVSRQEKPVDINDKRAGVILPPDQITTQASAAPTASLGNGVLASDPKKIRTVSIRPDGSAMADASPAGQGSSPLATMAEAPREAAPPPRVVNQPTADREPPRQAAPRAAPPVQHTASAPASSNAPLSLSPDVSAPRASAPMRTASVGPTQLAAPAATAGRTGGYAVQVSSQRSEADAQNAFRSLQGKYPSQLGSRQVLIHKADLGAKGTYYRAMVGPFANASDATQLCSSLKSAGGQCIVQRN